MGKSTIQDERYSDYCFFCGKPLNNKHSHHFIFGNGLRDLAEKDGLKATTCDSCHVVGNVLERVHSIEERPLKRYDVIINSIITALCGGLAGYMISVLI